MTLPTWCVFRDEAGQRWEDFEPLVDAITSTVLPRSWDEVGGPASIRGGTFGTGQRVGHLADVPRRIGKWQVSWKRFARSPRNLRPRRPPLRSRPGGTADGHGRDDGWRHGCRWDANARHGRNGRRNDGTGMGAAGMPGVGAKPDATPQPKKNDP